MCFVTTDYRFIHEQFGLHVAPEAVFATELRCSPAQ